MNYITFKTYNVPHCLPMLEPGFLTPGRRNVPSEWGPFDTNYMRCMTPHANYDVGVTVYLGNTRFTFMVCYAGYVPETHDRIAIRLHMRGETNIQV